jgi:lipooligosaccharide transport system ATP-binding protein
VNVVVSQDLKKEFSAGVFALAGVDLSVPKGHCLGLLGPNGAGKSTWIGCLYGVVVPSSGSIRVFDLDPKLQAREIKRRIGVVPQENALDEGLSVSENMMIYGAFVGLTSSRAQERVRSLLKWMNLEEKAHAPIRALSGGMKRRLAFVRALLNDPELVILDEPTTGLDPGVRHLLWEKVRELKREGRTVILTTHYMHEAEALCDEVAILRKGKIVEKGSPEQLIQKHCPGFVALFPLGTSEEKLRKEMEGTALLLRLHGQWAVRAQEWQMLADLQQRVGAKASMVRPSNLEDVYLSLTGEELSND